MYLRNDLIRFGRDQGNRSRISIYMYVTGGSSFLERLSNVSRTLKENKTNEFQIWNLSVPGNTWRQTYANKSCCNEHHVSSIGGKWLIEQGLAMRASSGGLNASQRHVYRIIEPDRPFLSSPSCVSTKRRVRFSIRFEQTTSSVRTDNKLVLFDIFLRFSYLHRQHHVLRLPADSLISVHDSSA